VEEIAAALAEDDVVRISRGDDGRTPVELAEAPGIWIADLLTAPPRPGCFWIWAISDSIRNGAARNAARLATRLAKIAA